MIKRLINFDKQDWDHVSFLFTNMMKQLFVKFNWHETKESYIWLKIHLMYDSHRVK